ncbi:3-keto-steroid reductase/17-beta-hydroxysteroid dehydrogenase 7-like isoform X2 [Amphiura filiformis]|uniref:3-keto-steroid reductase/17-beta-hydroxysteroid dehydrogenase 7-like isoform X2 n=1 Tax=Amphiura filiformis TaxID=82378 RepID=UPI003B21A061
MTSKQERVIIITGGNSGIGLSLAGRLLAVDTTLVICLACRNLSRADTARSKLLEDYPESVVEVLQLDTSDLKSVYKAAREVKQKYQRLDYVYCNAGIMPVTNVNWKNLLYGFTSLNSIVEMFTTGEGLLHLQDDCTKDGLKSIFCTNLFGHFVFIQELLDLMSNSGGAHIIWTSSSNARRAHFDINDLQHENGPQAYSSSKYAMDLLSIGLNEEYNKKGIYSHVSCPGLSMTNITNSILPAWFWTMTSPFLIVMRALVPRVTLNPDNGAESLVWLFEQDRSTVDQDYKYISHISVSIFGFLFIYRSGSLNRTGQQ